MVEPPATASPATDSDSERTCWICLAGDGELVNPCKCPQPCHKKCLARWQLQSAGRSEEHRCRFCASVYPSWKDSLTPPHLKPAIPVVSVHYNGICYRLRVKPGPEGFASFQRQLQRITGLPVLDCMQITFQCRAPDTAQELSFKGISAFDAAIHCAAISAAERMATQKSGRPSVSCTSRADEEVAPSSPSTPRLADRLPPIGGSHGAQASSTRQPTPPAESARPYRHSTGGNQDLVYSSRSRRVAEAAPANEQRMSMDSHALHRVDSQVVLQDREPAVLPDHDHGHKHTHRLRRFREFLRNLFV